MVYLNNTVVDDQGFWSLEFLYLRSFLSPIGGILGYKNQRERRKGRGCLASYQALPDNYWPKLPMMPTLRSAILNTGQFTGHGPERWFGDKGLCCQAWRPGFKPWSPHSGRRKPTASCFPLSSYVHLRMCSPAHTDTQDENGKCKHIVYWPWISLSESHSIFSWEEGEKARKVAQLMRVKEEGRKPVRWWHSW